MPKDEWGVKRLCSSCATRFYDLQNDPMICPSCGSSFDLAGLTNGKSRGTTPDKPDKSAKPAKVAEDLADDVDVDVLDDDDDVKLDDDLLDDDDDDTVNLDDIADVAKEDDET